MRMSVCRVYVFASIALLGVLAVPSTAGAQYRRNAAPEGGIAEDYHIEAAYGWWNATPELIVNSESLGIIGTDVDLVNMLGIEKHRLGKFDLVLKPAKKHRLKYQHLPIKYERDAFRVTQDFIFNGQRYTIGLPVTTSVDFSSDSFGYEYDFIHKPWFFVGASINVKVTNMHVDLQSPIGSEFFKQTAPIPAFGFAGRAYLHPNVSVDAEISFFRIPSSIEEQIEGDGSYNDFDIHTTYNINKYVGTQLGWRKTTIFYEAERDSGDLKFSGIYFGGVVRY
jgi:hypothetical protein